MLRSAWVNVSTNGRVFRQLVQMMPPEDSDNLRYYITTLPCLLVFHLPIAAGPCLAVDAAFYRSNESERSTNTFEISVSIAGKVFTPEIEGENIIPTPLGTGNDFPLAAEANGRYVRLTGTNADEHWLSVSEVSTRWCTVRGRERSRQEVAWQYEVS